MYRCALPKGPVRSHSRGSPAASSIRLALRTSSIVATRSASFVRWVLRWFGSRRLSSVLRLWCTNGVGDGLRPLCLCSGDLPGERHAEAGHAVDHRAGDPGLDLLGGQSPSPKAPADQNLVPVESGFNQGPLPITDGFLPAHSTLPGEHLDVLVTLSGLGLCSIAENRV